MKIVFYHLLISYKCINWFVIIIFWCNKIFFFVGTQNKLLSFWKLFLPLTYFLQINKLVHDSYFLILKYFSLLVHKINYYHFESYFLLLTYLSWWIAQQQEVRTLNLLSMWWKIWCILINITISNHGEK